VWGDTRSLLQGMTGQVGSGRGLLPRPDVVYLDPLFPGHEQRKTAERKPLRLLRAVVGQEPDEPEILSLALAAARHRVVVKRPLKAPFFAPSERTPVHQVFGRRVRFDVYPSTIQPGLWPG
jgi:16S rRNA (guanine1516-N2)-methyltransferase